MKVTKTVRQNAQSASEVLHSINILCTTEDYNAESQKLSQNQINQIHPKSNLCFLKYSSVWNKVKKTFEHF
jgi:hypothetical protein